VGSTIIVRSDARAAHVRRPRCRMADVAFAMLFAICATLGTTACGPTGKQRQQMMLLQEEQAEAAAAARAEAAGLAPGETGAPDVPAAGAAHVGGAPGTVPGGAPAPVIDAGHYRLAPGDIIDVTFPFHPEEDLRAPVRNDGRFNLPITGDLLVAGYTPEDLERVITEKASVRLKGPAVSVTIVELAEHRVFVTGQVARPGYAPYRPGMTAMQAIVERGGFVDDAKTDEIVHIQRVNGQVRNSKLDLQAIYEAGGNDTTAMAPNDILVVPRTWVGDADVFVDQWIRGLLPTIPVPTYDLTTYFLF